MVKWEYKFVEIYASSQGIETELNMIGNDGWELVSFVVNDDYFNFVFKRPKK